MTITKHIKGLIKYTFGILGFELKRKTSKKYIDAKKTIKIASSKGLTICEYVEEIWNIKGNTDFILQQLNQAGALKHCNEVCEIGPGTGRYLERVLKECKPACYHIYEVAKDWAAWLKKTYSPFVIAHSADGHSLSKTPSNCCGIVHAHGVFVYLSFLNCFEYFLEMVRICEREGYIVFDIYSDKEWNIEVINKWLASRDRYPVILPEDRVVEFFENQNCRLKCRFNARHGHSYSTYLVFQKEI